MINYRSILFIRNERQVIIFGRKYTLDTSKRMIRVQHSSIVIVKRIMNIYNLTLIRI